MKRMTTRTIKSRRTPPTVEKTIISVFSRSDICAICSTCTVPTHRTGYTRDEKVIAANKQTL